MPWTQLERELVRELYPFSTALEIGQWLGRGKSSVYAEAQKLKVFKSVEMIAQIAREKTLDANHGGRFTQFTSGHTSWNKGVKYPPEYRPGRLTQFKTGHRSKNTLPVGSFRISKDGYLEEKYREAPGGPSMRWKGRHRIVWEQVHGPVPEGFVICFLPGRFSAEKDKITIDAIECISRADLAVRNHPGTANPELRPLIQLKGAITRQVNRIKREQEATA